MFCFTCLCVYIDLTFGLDLQIPVGLMNKNEDKVITKSLFNLCFTGMMLLVNIRLYMATYNVSYWDHHDIIFLIKIYVNEW